MEQFDAIIIGIGQAGKPLANALTQEGNKIVVIEREHPGGSCVNYGCTPTKTMIASSSVSHLSKTASEVGIQVSQTEADFKKIIKRRNTIVEQSRNSIHKQMQENDHIKLIYGEAYFTGRKEVSVKLNGTNEVKKLQAERIFINVGTSPRVPKVEGLDKVNYYTSKSMMKLEELPDHLIILGGSYIGLEYGQMFRRFDSKVSIIETGPQLASREDEDVAHVLLQVLEKEGLDIYLNAEAEKVEKKGDSFEITLHNGTTKIITGSHLLIATGTSPNTEVLQLQEAGIETKEHGYIAVNENLQTNIEGIFALGDCKGGPEFTHISYDDYRIVKDYLYDKKQRSMNDRPVPYAMFTKPELGRIGLSEKQAKNEGRKFKIAKIPVNQIARANESNLTAGVLKVLVDNNNDRIIGAACLAEEGGELMSMLQIAMMGNLPYQKLRDGIFAHPTWAESFNTLFQSLSSPESDD